MTNPLDPQSNKRDENLDSNSKDSTEEKTKPKSLSLDDLVSRDSSYLTFKQDKPKVLGKDTELTPELRKELGATPPRDFKPYGNNIVGRQFFQMKKSEFAPKDSDRPIKEFKEPVDKFLTETPLGDDDALSPAEKQELTNTRELMLQARSAADLLSNTLHLARLYLHLRYIDEAKKALTLSLGIDPDNMLGKQLFTDLERIHPAETAAVMTPIEVDLSVALTKSSLRKRIKALSGGKVTVLGDLLIDELLEGKPERISREAPVLILEHVDTVLIPGGAANTAHNIVALGGDCHAIGICGEDDYAIKMATMLESCGITHTLVADKNRHTTVKTRILSKSHSLMQQLLRLDRISHEPLAPETEKRLISKIADSTRGYKAVILSDYKAGVVTDAVIKACTDLSKQQNLLVIVDAQGDFARFKDVTLMTPNQPDTEKAVGFELNTKEDLKKAGEKILSETNARALLVTRGAGGMVLFQKNQEMVEIPVFNRSDVFDVTGAGDTVVATMALALVSGASFVEAMALGNLAAGIVVRKLGTAVTSQQEMIDNLERLNLPE